MSEENKIGTYQFVADLVILAGNPVTLIFVGCVP